MIRSILIGAATGILSQTGIAAIVLNTPPERLPGILRSPFAKPLTALFAGGEIIANAAVSSLPPRTTPGPLLGRIAMGAGNAALLARANAQPLATSAIAGGAAAGVAATLATTSRSRITRVVPDILVAITETVVSVALAVRATR
jgi:hypothetical protein